MDGFVNNEDNEQNNNSRPLANSLPGLDGRLSEEQLKEFAVEEFWRLHGEMFGEIKSMLGTAKLTPIEELQNHEPNFTAMVDNLETYLGILKKLHEILESIDADSISHVEEYLTFVRQLAQAIEDDDPDGLGAAIAALDEKPYI